MNNTIPISRRGFLGGLASTPLVAASHSSDLVRFGWTDLHVSRLCQGTAFRKVGREPDDPEGQRILHRCLDLGINFFDSSNAYGWGGAEMALGKAIKGRRDKLVICTKVSTGQKPVNGVSKTVALTRERIHLEMEGSLKRLGTDYVDLYLIHNPDPVTPLADIADSMDALVKAGKCRYWGLSNHSAAQVSEAIELGRRPGKSRLAGLEDYYNVIADDRRVFMERELFPLIRKGRLGLMAFSPIAEGRLAPDRPVDPAARWAPVVKALDEVAKELGVSRPQVCVAWVLAHSEVTSVLAGAEKPEHVEDNFKGTQLKLPSSALRRLTAASDAALTPKAG